MAMSRGVADALLESLLTRIDARPKGSPLTVEITPQEADALRMVLGREPAETAPTEQPAAVAEKPSIDWSKYAATPIKTHRLCIDFGTAFSKICLVGNHDREIKPLNIGQYARYDNPLLVPSSVLVHEGRLYFGSEALQRSQTHRITHRRIDALKQFLSKDEITDIDQHPIDEAYQDAPSSLTKGAVLRLYCGYLTALGEAAARDLNYEPASLSRRFARPAWDATRSKAAETFMHRMLEDCRIIADHLQGEWRKGVPIARAQALLDAIAERSEDTYSNGLILESVLEATAAANAVTGGFEDFQGRRLMAVVDVGAGTTDFGLFAVFQSPKDKEKQRISELAKGSLVLRQAGDTLDDVLASMLIGKLHTAPGSDIERRARMKIQNSRRSLKEQLFAEGEAVHRTDDDEEIRVALDEFLAEPVVIQFTGELKKKFKACLGAVTKTNVESCGNRIHVVLTGGGAGLPMVRSLLEPGHGVHICKELKVDEDELRAIDAALPGRFAQLAVAIGGAMEQIPEQRGSYDDLGAGAPVTVRYRGFA